MKIQIRRGVFETNSSSCHSLIICSKGEFEKWKNGELKLDTRYCDDRKFVKSYKISKEDKENAEDEYNCEKDIYTKDWEDLSDEVKERYYEKYCDKYNLTQEHSKSYGEFMKCGCCEDNYCETFTQEYVSKSGDKIVAFGCYGHD